MSRYLLILFIPFLLSSCSSSQVITEDAQPTMIPASDTDPVPVEETAVNTNLSNLNLDQYRSSFSDTYSSRNNDIPAGFAEIKVETEENEDEQDLFEGYRVQIYSGQDVSMADTVAVHFRAWSDTTITGYQARTYTFFKAPYYRVHVGDFHDRDKAVSFSNILKRRFRDAWVVYDRVNPWNVPADTVHISVK